MEEVRLGTETSCMRFAVQTSQLGSNYEVYILAYARPSTTIHSRVALQGVWLELSAFKLYLNLAEKPIW